MTTINYPSTYSYSIKTPNMFICVYRGTEGSIGNMTVFTDYLVCDKKGRFTALLHIGVDSHVRLDVDGFSKTVFLRGTPIADFAILVGLTDKQIVRARKRLLRLYRDCPCVSGTWRTGPLAPDEAYKYCDQCGRAIDVRFD